MICSISQSRSSGEQLSSRTPVRMPSAQALGPSGFSRVSSGCTPDIAASWWSRSSSGSRFSSSTSLTKRSLSICWSCSSSGSSSSALCFSLRCAPVAKRSFQASANRVSVCAIRRSQLRTLRKASGTSLEEIAVDRTSDSSPRNSFRACALVFSIADADGGFAFTRR